ncbi:MAG: restriction endonuclease subunit S [Bacteroidaceae bacterium]|nr:restriction endonuclease subunit S [Bacteroidaceae bacterium]
MADNKQNKNPNVPNLSFKREQSESCFDSAERVINQKQNVPNLRFPEFTEDWVQYKCSDLLEFYSTNSLSWEQLDYDNNDLLNLHYGLIHVGLPTLVNVEQHNLPSVKPEFKPKNYTLCKSGDIAFADASEDTNEVAKPIEFYDCSDKQVVCGLHTIHGRDKLNTTEIGFKGYAFSSMPFHHKIRRLAQGSKIYSISSKNFSEVTIGIPQKEEQRKIVDLLSKLQERITTQNKIIEDLKKLKVAIIENTFCGKHYNYKIGDIITQISNRNKSNKETNVLSVSNKLGFVEQSEQFEDRTVASEDVTNYKIVRTNDFAYNPARINVGSIARLKQYESGIVSPMYICFHAKKNVLPEYLEMFFLTQYFKHEMYKRLEGSVRLCLSFEGLTNIPISIPEIPLQKEISEKILAFETKIGIEEHYLNALEKQKQYLLQQMFI